MFDNLTDKLNHTFNRLKRHGKLSDSNVKEALRELRLSLLEADVNYHVVKDFISAVKARALGKEVMASLTPGQHFIKIVKDELVLLMGTNATHLAFKGRGPTSIMVVGLQGSGKTTTIGKLALNLTKKGMKPYLVPADVYRPAAIEQLTKVGSNLHLPVHPSAIDTNPIVICQDAMKTAASQNYDVVLLDTAGRLHVDTELMNELRNIKHAIQPKQILLVADAMTGADAVNIAEKFDADVGISGVVLTKMDGDARGGAALSIKAVTGKPIFFVGTGEKMDALEVFHPERVVNRILGMGDVLSLIEKAQQAYDQKKAAELQHKLKKNEFTIEDFREHLQQVQKMGAISELIDKIPGIKNMMKKIPGQTPPPEEELKRIQAIINSMTKKERQNHAILNASRRRRIARGSGTSVQQVNSFIKNYLEMKKMMKKLNQFGARSLMRGLMSGRL